MLFYHSILFSQFNPVTYVDNFRLYYSQIVEHLFGIYPSFKSKSIFYRYNDKNKFGYVHGNNHGCWCFWDKFCL